MAIKAVIFDCFGVLIMAGHVFLRRDHPELVGLINELQAKSDVGELSRGQFNATIGNIIGITPQQVDERYWGTNKYNQPMIDWAGELKKSGKYKIGMLSNISRDWMDVSLPFFDRQNLFDVEILSGDVKLVKPDPNIFILMASRLGVKPDECVMIDDVEKNINGARQVGMHGIVYESPEQSQIELEKLVSQINA